MSDTEMCNSVVYRQFNEFIEPFPFSRFQLFKTCSRLILPTDSRQHFIVAKDNQSCETLPTINGSDKHQRRLSHEMENPLHSKPMVVFSPSIAYQNNLDSQIIPTKLNAKTSAFTPENSKINSKFATGPVHMPASLNYSNIFIKRQRGEKRPIPDEQKDEKYYERRKRNNEAAKKSRDARKLREDRIALRAAILEHENALLRAQLISLRDEITTLKQMMVSVAAPVSLNF